jgi:HAD superfamily hydrolase (TIGR01490 family)
MTRRRTVAIFDLDNTLLEGDTDTLWAEFLHQKGLMDEAFIQKMRDFFLDHQNATMDIEAYAECTYSPLRTYPLERMEALRAEFLDQTARRTRPAMLERVDWHRRKEHTVVMITNSHGFITERIADQLGFSERICTQAEFKDGRFTGRLAGVPAYREGKIIRLSAWMVEHRLNLDASWAYSDSYTDLPLLSLVANPVAVTPDDQLRRHAQEHRWRLMEFAESSSPAGPMRIRITSP